MDHLFTSWRRKQRHHDRRSLSLALLHSLQMKSSRNNNIQADTKCKNGLGRVCKTFMLRFDSDPRLQSSSHYKQTVGAPFSDAASDAFTPRCGGLPARNHWKRTFRRRSPTQKAPYLSNRRILDTWPKTRFRYVIATIPECGQSRPPFRP